MAAYDEKADIWSFGITALELAKGYAPYARLQTMKILLTTVTQPPPTLKSYPDYLETKSKFSKNFNEIIRLCLQKNPNLRPSAETLLSRKFFQKARPKSTLVSELLNGPILIPDTLDPNAAKDIQAVEDKIAKATIAPHKSSGVMAVCIYIYFLTV